MKIQYPGVAEAVDTDLRNLTLVLPLIKRLAPGLDVKALYGELRERIGEELDYEIEAQNHRAVARAHRGHPFVLVPDVLTRLSSRRVLVTELIEGARFEEVKRRDDATRDRFGEIVFRFYFGLVKYLRRASGDPHPGNYLLLPDGRVGFLDFGLMRVLDEGYLEGEQAVAAAVEAGDAVRVHASLSALGYLPDPGTFDPEGLLAQISAMGAWYLEPGERRFTPAYVSTCSTPRAARARPGSTRCGARRSRRRRSCCGAWRASCSPRSARSARSADWNAIAREFYLDAPPATPLGEEEAAFWAPSSAAA